MASKKVEVDVEGRRLRLSNLDKVLYPETGFTKGEVIDYYTRVAPWLLPHLRGRALTLKRYPNGVEGGHFFEKQCPSHAPDWVRTASIDVNHRTIDFVLCDDLPTLVWLANLADLELHPSLAFADRPNVPSVLAFDLDPGAPAGLRECCQVALMVRDTLADLDVECFAKTSGSKGLQVYAPLNGDVEYEDTKPFARALARLLESQNEKLVISTMKRSARDGKIFIDWSQNTRHKTTVGVFSLRARERPTISTPLEWNAVQDAAAGGNLDGLVLGPEEMVERLEAEGDPFASVLDRKQKLPRLQPSGES